MLACDPSVVVTQYRPMVLKYVRLVHSRRGLPDDVLDDMIQDAMIALLRAAEKFEPDRGCKFLTFAINCVRNQANLSARRLLSHSARMTHAQSGVVEKGYSPEDCLTRLIRREDVVKIERIAAGLSEKDRHVLRRFCEGYNLEEIAREMGVSAPMVRRRRERALCVIRSALGIQSDTSSKKRQTASSLV